MYPYYYSVCIVWYYKKLNVVKNTKIKIKTSYVVRRLGDPVKLVASLYMMNAIEAKSSVELAFQILYVIINLSSNYSRF